MRQKEKIYGTVKRQMMRIIGCFLLVFAVCPAVHIHASAANEEGDETLSVDFSGQSDSYSAVLYNNADGLPTSEANAIAQTEEGFIWIGSYSGLIRYDGNVFERMDSTSGIASVVSLHVDRMNRLWIGTNDGGAAVMEKNEIRMFDRDDGLRSLSVRAIEEDCSGVIYMATAKGIVWTDDAEHLHLIEDERVKDQAIRRMAAGDDNVIYCAAQDGTVFTLENGEVRDYYEVDTLHFEKVVSVTPDTTRSDFVYLGTEESHIIRGRLGNELTNIEIIDTAPLRYINSIRVIQNQIWITADNGIGYIEDGEIHVLENVPMNNSVERLMIDYAGNLWFTSSRQGVMKIVPNRFTDLSERYDLPEMVVNSTCLYDNRLFIGADRGLTVIGENGALEELPLESCTGADGEAMEEDDLLKLMDGVRIRSIMRDRENRIWLSTYSTCGLVCYDGKKAVCYRMADGMTSERIRTSYECSDGTILASASGGGVIVLRDDSIKEVYNTEDGLSNADILTIAEGENGDLIFGSDGDGIYILRAGEMIHRGLEDGLGSEVVLRIKKDRSKDLFWIVTSNSIAYMDSDYQITTIKRFPYSNNFDLYENSRGEMWILSSNGIYVAAKEELLANENQDPVFYGRENGLPCITTANSFSDITSDGDLYIAGTTGAAKVNIDASADNISEVKMAVPYIEADGTYILPDENGEFVIPAKCRKLTIYGYIYTYALTNPQITYYLDGFDGEAATVFSSEYGPVDYTNLSGGTYRYVMHLSDAMGHGSNELSVTIIKKKAMYEELWFRIVSVLVFLGLIALCVWLYVRHKTKVFERKEKENKIFIREMTEAFAATIDMKDAYTNGHSKRVAEYTAKLTKELGYDDELVEKYYNIALLHDIGKIGIPAEVLNKPGKLTDEEFKIIKSHSTLGYRALKNISIMPELAIGAGSHHERPDGKGYPRGLKGNDIPRVAQIIAVADTFDAMYSDRPYRKRMNFDKVVSIIREVSGTQLEPDVVDAFLRLVEKGEFRDPDDHGGGSMEDINNIHKGYEQKEAEEKAKNSDKG